jgi:hypothetical protein
MLRITAVLCCERQATFKPPVSIIYGILIEAKSVKPKHSADSNDSAENELQKFMGNGIAASY